MPGLVSIAGSDGSHVERRAEEGVVPPGSVNIDWILSLLDPGFYRGDDHPTTANLQRYTDTTRIQRIGDPNPNSG
jgi:hypothetical protein